jgi:hypothetical protein
MSRDGKLPGPTREFDGNSLTNMNVVGDVESRRQEVIKQITLGEEHIRSLKSYLNTLAPISRLPPETLSMIFAKCAAQNKQAFTCGRSIPWIAITHICRHWRSVALECPRIWANLVFASHKMTSEMLRRSKSGPIVIKATLPGTALEKSALLLAMEQIHRTRILHLKFCHIPTSSITSNLRRLAPRLESLRLLLDVEVPRLNADFFLPVPELPFNGETPQLRHVQLVGCGISWDIPIFNKLHHLEIKSPSIRPTMKQILVVLGKMPLLRKLILKDACPLFPDNAAFHNNHHTVQLLQLSVLDLTDDPCHCSNLLNHLSYPATSSVRLKFAWSTVDFERTLSAMISTGGWDKDGKLIGSLFVEQDVCDIRFRCWITDSCSPSYLATTTSQLELVVCAPHLKDASLLAVCKALPLSHLKILHVALDLTAGHWLDAFGNCPRLHTIRVRNATLSGLVRALDPAGDFLSPQLHTLTLREIDFEEFPTEDCPHLLPALEACLRERSHRNITVKELHLYDCLWLSADDVRSLEEFVDDVTWDGLEKDDWTEDEDS